MNCAMMGVMMPKPTCGITDDDAAQAPCFTEAWEGRIDRRYFCSMDEVHDYLSELDDAYPAPHDRVPTRHDLPCQMLTAMINGRWSHEIVPPEEAQMLVWMAKGVPEQDTQAYAKRIAASTARYNRRRAHVSNYRRAMRAIEGYEESEHGDPANTISVKLIPTGGVYDDE